MSVAKEWRGQGVGAALLEEGFAPNEIKYGPNDYVGDFQMGLTL